MGPRSDLSAAHVDDVDLSYGAHQLHCLARLVKRLLGGQVVGCALVALVPREGEPSTT